MVAVLFLISPTDGTYAEDYVGAETYIHNIDNNVAVYTEVFALNKDINLDTTVYLKYTVDFIRPRSSSGGEEGDEDEDSGAVRGYTEVSAVSGASTSASAVGGSAGNDTRNEFTAGLTHNFENVFGIEVYYDYSKEKDYTSSTPSVSLKKDLFEKNMTLTLGYSRSMDQVYGEFMDGRENRDTDNYFVGITQVLSPYTVAQLGYSRSQMRGFASEGIRLVPIDGATQDSCTDKSMTCVDEAFPDSRSRNSYILGVNHYFEGGIMDRSAVKLTLRYYNDDWDIESYTEEVEYYKYLTDQVILRADLRYYDQSAASFVKDSYTSADEFKSSSPQLLKFNSQLAGLKLMYFFDGNSFVEGKYEFYTQSISVDTHVFMLGLRFYL
jgi:hypothetical protein